MLFHVQVERFRPNHSLFVLVAEAVSNSDFYCGVRTGCYHMEHMRMQLAFVLFAVKVLVPERIRDVKTDEHLRVLSLAALTLKRFSILGNLDFPIVGPVPDVYHYRVVSIPSGIVRPPWKMVNKNTDFSVILEVFPYCIHVKASELLA